MAREFTFHDAKDILVSRIGVPEETVTSTDQTFEDLGLDSLAFVEIQLAIQQEYGLAIPDEDAEKLMTVGAGIEYVNQRLAEKEGE